MQELFTLISALLWRLLAPDSLLLLLLLAGTVLLFTRWFRLGRALVAAVAGALLAIACLPLGDWLIQPLETRFPPPPAEAPPPDGIITLSGGDLAWLSWRYGQPVLSDAAERLTAFATLALRYPAARLVVSDGPGPLASGKPLGALAARQLLPTLGIPLERVMWEERARNTHDNARYSKALANPAPGERWWLVTSAYHMPRAVGAFRRAGWEVLPYPVDYRAALTGSLLRFAPGASLMLFRVAAKEWLGLAAYRLSGRIDTLFPAPAVPPTGLP